MKTRWRKTPTSRRNLRVLSTMVCALSRGGIGWPVEAGTGQVSETVMILMGSPSVSSWCRNVVSLPAALRPTIISDERFLRTSWGWFRSDSKRLRLLRAFECVGCQSQCARCGSRQARRDWSLNQLRQRFQRTWGTEHKQTGVGEVNGNFS